jgi:ribonuclease HI
MCKLGWLETFPALPPSKRFPRFRKPTEDDTPDSLFGPAISVPASIPAPRYIRRTNPREFLIFTDGSYLDNGSEAATAGCAFVFRPETYPSMIPRTTVQGFATQSMQLHTLGFQSFRLELQGPSGGRAPQTSNRAELRAVIGALQFRYWTGEGFQRLVIATDSAYVVDGTAEWIETWQQNGWKTARGKAVLNQDLWKELIKKLNKWRANGLEVVFWRIPRALNTIADSLAKAAATKPAEVKWSALQGVIC